MISDSKRCAPSTAVVTGQSSVQPRKSRLTRYPSASTRRNAMMMPPSSRSQAIGSSGSGWQGDTVTRVFQHFASHAGRQELSAWFFLPARARVNLQKSLSYVSPCHPEAGYFRIKSQRLTVQKSVTYDAKVRDLRPVIPWLTNRNPIIKPLKIKQARHLEVIPSKACKRAYKHQSKENLWKSMSNCEQV